MSTGAVAQSCGVTRDSVLHWIHSGKLRAFRTPGGHFRILRENLSLFLRESGCNYLPAVHDGGAQRILVVDDEPSIRELLRDLLQGAGYEVHTAARASEALDTISSQPPDLVITDVALPGEGGAGLTRALREHPVMSTVPVIAVTGAFHDDRLHEIYKAGADVLLSKPFQPDHILGEVRRLLDSQRPADSGETE